MGMWRRLGLERCLLVLRRGCVTFIFGRSRFLMRVLSVSCGWPRGGRAEVVGPGGG